MVMMIKIIIIMMMIMMIMTSSSQVPGSASTSPVPRPSSHAHSSRRASVTSCIHRCYCTLTLILQCCDEVILHLVPANTGVTLH